MKWTIDKSFSFCYGHRVHNQRLNTKFTDNGDSCLACRHLHGHEGLVKVFLEEDSNSTNLSETGMVTDFKHLGWFKNFLDNTLDHKMILDIKDPLLPYELPELHSPDTFELQTEYLTYWENEFWTVNLTRLINDMNLNLENPRDKALLEKYEGIVLVDFVPTSENLSGWLLSIANKKMKDLAGVRVKAVEYWETPKSHCRVEQ